MTERLTRRFERAYMPEPNSGCWLWVGHVKPNGYGTLGVKRGERWVTVLAHRLGYELHRGKIPAGLDLDHLCRNRMCVNPWHLEAVTRAENLRRSPLMSRQEGKKHCPAGHPYSGVNSRGARICHTCAAAAARRWFQKRR